MRLQAYIFCLGLTPGVALADRPPPVHWQAAFSASTSTTLNSEIIQKPQYGLSLQGSQGRSFFGAEMHTAHSNLGTDSEDKFYLGYDQRLKPFSVRYEVTYKVYPGTRSGYTDRGLLYQVSASRSLFGVNGSIGLEYTGTDYSTTRKSYGYDVSLSRSLAPKLSGWISLSHKREWGSVDYTNTNIGLYYQATSKIGFSTSLNTWHAFAPWGRDHPSLSISLSRRL